MANLKHMDIIKRGVDSWNVWRGNNSHILPSLSDAGLHMAYLNKANLSRADLADAGLRLADLIEANLKGADLYWANLSEANLKRANLEKANLQGANATGSNLREANLTGANLSQANISRANLADAQLVRVNLNGADLSGADLRGANLKKANLIGANLTNANLDGADLSDATIGATLFGNVDLSNVKGLETLVHLGPSTVGIDTIYKSRGSVPVVFLKNAGVPDHLIDYIELFVDRNEKYYSCFISCSSRDQEFAENLQSYLKTHGVRCWLATEKMKRRDRKHKIINSAVNIHDKVIMILSENSVERDWTENEIETILLKENKEDKAVLFSLAIDDAIKFTEKPWAIKMRRAHRIHDFSMWEDSNEFEEAFSQLLDELIADEKLSEEDAEFEEEYTVNSDRYSAVIDQKIAWNNIKYARLT
jgi:uncharacterized protein YjbI with pentapeptide repeats